MIRRAKAVAFALLLAASFGCAGAKPKPGPRRAESRGAAALPHSSDAVFKDPAGARTPEKGSSVEIRFTSEDQGWPPGTYARDGEYRRALQLAHLYAHAEHAMKGTVALDVGAEEASLEPVLAQILKEFREKNASREPLASSRPPLEPVRFAPGWEPFDYAAAIAGARRGARHGALAHCVETWRHAAHLRQHVWAHLGAQPPPPGRRVVLVEGASFPDPLYGYVLVVDGVAVKGLLEDEVQRVPAPEVHAYAAVALGAGLGSDESLADVLSDGPCWFVTVREGPREAQFALFAPFSSKSDSPAELVLRELMSGLEWAWAGPE